MFKNYKIDHCLKIGNEERRTKVVAVTEDREDQALFGLGFMVTKNLARPV